MTAPRYKSVSAIGNRVTLVTCLGEVQAARQRRRQFGGDGSIIRVTLDKQTDHVGRAFDSRNDRCAMARPRGAASGFDNAQHHRSGVEDLKVYVVDDGLERPASI